MARGVVDDRGTALSTIAVRDALDLDRQAQLPRALSRSIRAAIEGKSTLNPRLTKRHILMLFVIVLTQSSLRFVPGLHALAWWQQTAYGIGAFLLAFMFIWWIPIRPDKRVLQMLLNARYCAGCLFFLEGLPAEPDGCTVCPECGAAWRLPPHSPPPPR